jgi:hypothetical protein
MCAYYTPRSSFSSNSFTPKYNFVETPQPTQPQPAYYDDNEPDVVWEKKEEILEKRQKCFKKDGKKKKKQPRIPGQKLLIKLHKEQQFENSLNRVVKGFLKA